MNATARQSAKDKILDAAVSLIRSQGYAATTVDDLCAEAGVTKGAFFHHFKSKEDLGVAAAAYWSELARNLFEAAPYHAHADPLDRLLGYIDFRKSLLTGPIPDYTCLVGTMVQEAYDSYPAIREACGRCITLHTATLEGDIRQAIDKHGIEASWTPKSLGLYTQAVLQGAFILAKATGDTRAARDAVDHLRGYVELLFHKPATTATQPKRRK
jgi:TetR/AcrR family transcriptional regulator, transcriptional repressor for nem operon